MLDKRSGGATVDEFKRFAVEQTRARIMSPGPIPVIWYDTLDIYYGTFLYGGACRLLMRVYKLFIESMF